MLINCMKVKSYYFMNAVHLIERQSILPNKENFPIIGIKGYKQLLLGVIEEGENMNE